MLKYLLRLYTIWYRKYIYLKLKYNVYNSLVLSILIYGCEKWKINSVMYKKSKWSKTALYKTVRDTLSGNTYYYICKAQDYFHNRQLKRINEISIHFMDNIQTLRPLKNANAMHG